jgi:hypothetical protein
MAEVSIVSGDDQALQLMIDEARSLASGAQAGIPDRLADLLARLAHCAVNAGKSHLARELSIQAESSAREAGGPSWQAPLFSRIATATARAGDLPRARELIAEAESAADAITDPYWRDQELGSAARALTDIGDYPRAEAAILRIANPRNRDAPLVYLACAAARDGRCDLAESIARSLPGPEAGRQEWSRSWVAEAIFEAGDYARAEALVRSYTDPMKRRIALRSCAVKLAEAGRHDHAITIARSIDDSYSQGSALGEVAGKIAEAGNHDRAEAVAYSIGDPFEQAKALAALAIRVAAAGGRDRAEALADTIEYANLQGHEYAELQSKVSASIAMALARAGEHDRARLLAAKAEAIARGHIMPHRRIEVLNLTVMAIARTGDYARAKNIMPADFPRRTLQLAQIAEMATEGDYRHAGQLASEVITLARNSTFSDYDIDLKRHLAIFAARRDDRDVAETLARSIDGYWGARTLADVAALIGQHGDRHRARNLADQAAETARTINYLQGRAKALAEVAVVMSQVSDHDRIQALAAEAEQAARAIDTTAGDYNAKGDQGEALGHVAVAIARSGDHDRAVDLARTITEAGPQGSALRHIVALIAQAGNHDQATDLAHTITDPGSRAEALLDMATKISDHARSRQLAADAGAAALSIKYQAPKARALATVARAMADIGSDDDARDLLTAAERSARDMENPGPADLASLAEVAATIMQAGDSRRATRLLAHLLAKDNSHAWWLEPLSRSFPEAIGDALEIMIDAYAHPSMPVP